MADWTGRDRKRQGETGGERHRVCALNHRFIRGEKLYETENDFGMNSE